MKPAIARLRALGRRVRRLPNGRYEVQGVSPSVRACDLETIADAFETMAALEQQGEQT